MRAVLPVVFLAFGCTSDAPDAPLEADDPVIYEPPCRGMPCGNSPEVLRNGIYHASVKGEPDDWGFYLEAKNGRAQIYKGGLSWDLNVVHGELFGTSSAGVLKGEALNGAELRVMNAGNPVYKILIGAVTVLDLPYGTKPKQPVYAMTWQPNGKPPTNESICNASDWPIDKDQRMGMGLTDVILHEGDDYAVGPKTVSRDEEWDPTWFNFGCAGRTLAKMRLLGYTRDNQPVSNLAWGGGWAERQAAFKMLTGDYCGTGKEYTETGIPIMWSNGDHLPYPVAPTTIEALWTERRATCVNEARLEAALGVDIWPQLIADECYLVYCDLLSGPGDPLFDSYSFSENAKIITSYW